MIWWFDDLKMFDERLVSIQLQFFTMTSARFICLSFYTLLFTLSFHLSVAQYAHPDSLSLSLVKIIAGNFQMMTSDKLNNFYALTNTGSLIKFNENGDSVAAYNDVKKFGYPSSIDVSNPLRPLLFYKNFGTVITLDQLLTQRNVMQLRKKGIISTAAICNSYDNNIWIFDDRNYKIIKMDENLNTVTETTDLRTMLEEAPEPLLMCEVANQLVLYDSTKGVFLFDLMGGYKKNIPWLKWKTTGCTNGDLWGIHNGQLVAAYLNKQRLPLYEMKTYAIPSFVANARSISISNGKLILADKNGISIYKTGIIQ